LAASVPPLVKITWPGSAPTSRATLARAASTAARAARPSAWIEDGLPTSFAARTTASAASGRIGAVAL
jgi:hypothetical protein